MTLYYSLVFAILVFEMALFMMLIAPMPDSIRRKIFDFLLRSPLVAKLEHGMRITFIFIFILFLDSVNRVYRVQVEMAQLSKNSGAAAAAALGSDRMEVQARKFYSQRNMYLTGFTLFLSLILSRYYNMIDEKLKLQGKLERYEGGSNVSGNDTDKSSKGGRVSEIGQRENKLKEKDDEIARLKDTVAKKNNKIAELETSFGNLRKQFDDHNTESHPTNPADKKTN